MTGLRRGVAGFIAQILNDETQSCIQVQLLEHLLTAHRILDESRSHQVGQHRQISHVGNVSIDFCRKLPAEGLKTGVKLQDLSAERVCFHCRFVIGSKCFELGDWKRMQLHKIGEAHPLQTLQNQIGGAIATTDTGSDQSDRLDIEKVVFAFPLRALGPEECDTEHSLVREGVREHFAIAWLENVKREQGVRKKYCARQLHHRRLFW